jgi:dethiobiotin synthetase
MTRGIFITGTDTGVGKTVITAALLRLAGRQGLRAVGLKPVASGSDRGAQGLRNIDAETLRAAASLKLPYETVNPFCFEPAIAPHLAARESGTPVRLEDLLAWYRRASAGADLALVEGAGGWRVPLHPDGFLSDLPEAFGLDVVLVVGLRLGCLNHARLTFESIVSAGRCRFAGWIGNEIDPACERREEIVATLAGLLGRPALGRVPHARPATSDRAGPIHVELPESAALLELLGGKP